MFYNRFCWLLQKEICNQRAIFTSTASHLLNKRGYFSGSKNFILLPNRAWCSTATCKTMSITYVIYNCNSTRLKWNHSKQYRGWYWIIWRFFFENVPVLAWLIVWQHEHRTLVAPRVYISNVRQPPQTRWDISIPAQITEVWSLCSKISDKRKKN